MIYYVTIFYLVEEMDIVSYSKIFILYLALSLNKFLLSLKN